jgi:hypothetical protein
MARTSARYITWYFLESELTNGFVENLDFGEVRRTNTPDLPRTQACDNIFLHRDSNELIITHDHDRISLGLWATLLKVPGLRKPCASIYRQILQTRKRRYWIGMVKPVYAG